MSKPARSTRPWCPPCHSPNAARTAPLRTWASWPFVTFPVRRESPILLKVAPRDTPALCIEDQCSGGRDIHGRPPPPGPQPPALSVGHGATAPVVTVTVSPGGEETIEAEAPAPLWLVDIDGCVCAADEDVHTATCPPDEPDGWLVGAGLCVIVLRDALFNRIMSACLSLQVAPASPPNSRTFPLITGRTVLASQHPSWSPCPITPLSRLLPTCPRE